jgi:hypothetical protein
VEDCYQPTTGWGRGVVLVLLLGLCEPLPITRVFGSPETDTIGAGSRLSCSITAAPVVFPRWGTIPPGMFAAWAYSAAREPPHDPITFPEEALVFTHHGVPGGILGGQRDLPPRRRTSGHAGTVARRRHHVACYQASSLRLGQWILERKTPW